MADSGLKKHAVISLAVVVLMLLAPLLMLVPGASSAPSVVTTITVGDNPWGVGVNPATNTVYVSNWYDNDVSVIDGATNTVTDTVNVGTSGAAGVAVNPATNTVYVLNSGDSDMYVIDGATNTVTTTVDVGSSPLHLSVNPATNTVYVANRSGDSVSVIDGATNTVTATIPVGDPFGIDLNPATNLIYVTNSAGDAVAVIDGATNTVTGNVPLTAGSGPGSICVNPTTNLAYVTSWSKNNVSVIDCATNTMTTTVVVGTNPADLDVNPATNLVYTANNGSDNVSIIDGATNTLVTNVAAGYGPGGVGVNPDTGRVYVDNCGDDTVSVIADPDIVPFSDEFVSDTLDADWTWTDPLGDCGYSLTANPGYLRVSAPDGGHDLLAGGKLRRATHHQTGEWRLRHRDQGAIRSASTMRSSAGILVWSDSDNFLLLNRRCSTEGQTVILRSRRGRYDFIGLCRLQRYGHLPAAGQGGRRLLLLLRQRRHQLEFAGAVTMAVTDPVEVGLLVIDQWQDNPIYADFDYFRFNQHAISASVSGGHGSADPGTQAVTRGTSAVVDLTPDTGYFVASVTDNGTEVTPTPTDSYVIPCVTNNHEVEVTFSPFSDEFTETTLDPGWTWIDPLDDCGYSLTANPGYLRISVPDGNHDLWPGGNYNAPRVTQLAGGDFSVETRVLFNPQYDSQNAGILVWADSVNLVRLERSTFNTVMLASVVGGSGTVQSKSYSGTDTYLRLVRAGNDFTGYYSSDGVNWNLVGSAAITASDPVYTGLMVVDQYQDNPISADFDYFRYLAAIDVTASPAEGGTVDGSGYYNVGDTVDLEATPAEGYDFINWTEGGLEVSTDAAYSFTATTGRTLTAHFARKTYAVMVGLDPGVEDSGTVTGSSNWKGIQGMSYTQASLAWDGTGLYAGTWGHGVWYYDPEEVSWHNTGGLISGYNVFSLAWDGTGLYAGTENNGVWYYDPGTGIWTDTTGPVAGYSITSLAWDGTGLYAGTYGQGVFRYDPGVPGWSDTGIGESEEICLLAGLGRHRTVCRHLEYRRLALRSRCFRLERYWNGGERRLRQLSALGRHRPLCRNVLRWRGLAI